MADAPEGAGEVSGMGGRPKTTTYKEMIERAEREYFCVLLNATKGNKSMAARMAGLDRSTLRRKLKRLGIPHG